MQRDRLHSAHPLHSGPGCNTGDAGEGFRVLYEILEFLQSQYLSSQMAGSSKFEPSLLGAGERYTSFCRKCTDDFDDGRLEQVHVTDGGRSEQVHEKKRFYFQLKK